MKDVSYDLLADELRRLVPGQLEAAGAESCGPEAGGGLRQLGPLAEGQTSAGLVGAGAVLCDTLIDGLVLRGDTSDGKCSADGELKLIKIFEAETKVNKVNSTLTCCRCSA